MRNMELLVRETLADQAARLPAENSLASWYRNRRRKRRRQGATVVAAAALLAAAVAALPFGPPDVEAPRAIGGFAAEPTSDGAVTQGGSTSRAVDFTTFGELRTNSSAVVVATVAEVAPGPPVSTDPEQIVLENLQVRLMIEQVLWGAVTQPEALLHQISPTGFGAPALEEGATYLLFLRGSVEDSQYGAGAYSITGDRGVYQLVDGKAFYRGSADPELPISLDEAKAIRWAAGDEVVQPADVVAAHLNAVEFNTIDTLRTASDLVIRARVTAQQRNVAEDTTTSELEPQTVLFGKTLPETLRLTQIGTPETKPYASAEVLQEGHEYILFLAHIGDDTYTIVGERGLYRVMPAQIGQREFIEFLGAGPWERLPPRTTLAALTVDLNTEN